MPDTTPEPIPESPEAAGVAERFPDDNGQIEAARLLGNDARDRLRADGFTDQEIDEWAETYTAEIGSGTVDDFVTWIRRREEQA